MDAPVEKSPIAWQPVTPRGVAAFARASWPRLLLVQLVFALFAAAATVWFLTENWFPVLARAIDAMPAQGEIRRGALDWREDSPTNLADNVFLALAVDLDHSRAA